MNTDLPFAILQFLVDNPWIVWLWLGATVTTAGLRSAYDIEADRPRWVKFLITVLDILQFNLSGPAKLISSQIKGNKT